MRWDFKMVAYAGAKHPSIDAGEPLMILNHAGLHTAQMEMRAFESRMRRGEVGRVDVHDLRSGELTQLGCDLANPWRGLQ